MLEKRGKMLMICDIFDVSSKTCVCIERRIWRHFPFWPRSMEPHYAPDLITCVSHFYWRISKRDINVGGRNRPRIASFLIWKPTHSHFQLIFLKVRNFNCSKHENRISSPLIASNAKRTASLLTVPVCPFGKRETLPRGQLHEQNLLHRLDTVHRMLQPAP